MAQPNDHSGAPFLTANTRRKEDLDDSSLLEVMAWNYKSFL